MKNIKVDFFSKSKKWPRRIPKIKNITNKTIKKMSSYFKRDYICLLYTSPSPRDPKTSRMPSSA